MKSVIIPGASGVSPKKTLIEEIDIYTPTTINRRATIIEATPSALP